MNDLILNISKTSPYTLNISLASFVYISFPGITRFILSIDDRFYLI